ncbi:helicase [Microbacterium testaceum]|uniref:helicase n=1 Tax=Microbacterium testaceum TaxID=2033 RepID=UPI000AF927F2|nr:helicase [Microbacterium testaceum]
MPGVVTVVGITAVTVGLTVALAAACGAAVQAQKLAGTADAAALAAADTVSGAVDGVACDAAAAVAVADGATLEECVLDGLVATVTVGTAYGGIPFDAHSRAGPLDTTARAVSGNPTRNACVWCAAKKGPQWQTARSS